jgi:hypothetical protein
VEEKRVVAYGSGSALLPSKYIDAALADLEAALAVTPDNAEILSFEFYCALLKPDFKLAKRNALKLASFGDGRCLRQYAEALAGFGIKDTF